MRDLTLQLMLSTVCVILCLKMCPFFWSLHHYAVAGLYKCYILHELFHFHDSMLTKITLFNMVRLQNTSSLFVRSWPSTPTPKPRSLLWTLLGSQLEPWLWCTNSQGPALLTLLNTSELAPKSGETCWFDPAPLRLDHQQESPDSPHSLDLRADRPCIPDLGFSIKPHFHPNCCFV